MSKKKTSQEMLAEGIEMMHPVYAAYLRQRLDVTYANYLIKAFNEIDGTETPLVEYDKRETSVVTTPQEQTN